MFHWNPDFSWFLCMFVIWGFPSVQGGHVVLRDWTQHQEFEALQLVKKKRKGLTEKQISEKAEDMWKTRLCYNYYNHPDKCPLKDGECRYAHGNHELRVKEIKKP